MRRSPLVRPLLILAAAAPLPLSAQVEQRTLRGAHVAIYNLAGRLTATAASGNAVEVQVTRRGADAARLRVESGAIGDRETLRIVYPSDRIVYPEMSGRGRISGMSVRDDGTFGGGDWRDRDDRVEIRSSGSGMEAWADLAVRVPKGQRISLYLAAGRVEVTNVEGDILVDVSAADVDVSGTRGELLLDTGSGRVSVRDATGSVTVDAGSGGISLTGVKGTRLDLDTGSGSVDASDIEVGDFNADVGSGGLRLMRLKAPRISVETGSGGATLDVLSAIERLSVESGSGGITVRAPATLSAEVRIETGSGGFQTDFEVTTRRMSRNYLEGRIGDGKGRIEIESGSGTVRLLRN